MTLKKMNIGIRTFHCAHNYGAVLQCYALQEVLKGMGHTVEVIDYRPSYLKVPYSIISLHRVLCTNPITLCKRLVSECLTLPWRIGRYQVFSKFIKKQFHLSNLWHSVRSYDAIVFGSDQIWNFEITRGLDEKYWGKLPFPKGSKKYIVYAASMEISVVNEISKGIISNFLRNFDAISVRENKLENLLQPLTEKKICTVLDPTLLAPLAIWKNFISLPPRESGYVLVYEVRPEKSILKIANYIAEQIKVPVVGVAAFPTWRRYNGLHQKESPQDFINWIRNASCVVTTSFHGTAYSILFNRPFYSIRLGFGDNRIISLLNILRLTERVIGKDEMPIYQDIDFEFANKKLDELRNESFSFLLTSLEGE